jgi:hypothetical protein
MLERGDVEQVNTLPAPMNAAIKTGTVHQRPVQAIQQGRKDMILFVSHEPSELKEQPDQKAKPSATNNSRLRGQVRPALLFLLASQQPIHFSRASY